MLPLSVGSLRDPSDSSDAGGEYMRSYGTETALGRDTGYDRLQVLTYRISPAHRSAQW